MADEGKIRDCAELEARLTPYVDGEDVPADHRAVSAHLSACPPCRQHADAEATARDYVHVRRDQLRVAAPESLRTRCANLQAASGSEAPILGHRRSTFVRRWAPLSVAATLVLAVAGVFLFGLNNPVQALAASLTLDHVKCLKIGDTDPNTDAAIEAKGWERKQGWPIVVPQTLASEQLTLVDVRHCLSSDGGTAHLMYTWHGSPLSLYVLPQDIGRAGVVDKMGHSAVIWCANRRTYAVVADGHPQDLNRIVEYMKANAK